MSEQDTPVDYSAKFTPAGAPVEATPEPMTAFSTPASSEPEVMAPTGQPSYLAVNVDVGTLRLRDGAGSHAKIIDFLPAGAVLKVLDEDVPDWPQIEYTVPGQPAVVGYVSRAFVVEAPAPASA